MKILFILPEYYPHSGGGISTYYINYIKALRPYCHRIKVIVGSGFYNTENSFEINGVEVEALKPQLFELMLRRFTQFNITPEVKSNIAAAWAMYEQADKGEGFDIIECADFGLGFVPWVISHNKPVITRLHGSAGQIAMHENEDGSNAFSNAFTKQTELLLLSLCDARITHSDSNRKYWNNLLHTDNVIKIDPVFHTGMQVALPFNQRESNALVTGRVQRWKGAVELCKAVELLEQHKRPSINWYGRDMPYSTEQTTEQYLAENFKNVWGKSVVHRLAAPHDIITQKQCKTRFGIIPSTWDMYNFTCLEFLACGTPVICSDGAGVSDIIEHGTNGFKYPASNVKALSECLKFVNEMGEEEYNKMCASALQSVKKLNAETVIPQNIEQYEKVMVSFTPASANQYLTSIYTPQDVDYDIKPLLDKQPLKKLSGYVLKRLAKKISGIK